MYKKYLPLSFSSRICLYCQILFILYLILFLYYFSKLLSQSFSSFYWKANTIYGVVTILLGIFGIAPNTALHFQAKELKFSLFRPQNILPMDFMFCHMASSKFQADFMLACLKSDFLLADLPKRHKTSDTQHLLLSRLFFPFHSNSSGIPCSPSGILVIFLTNALFIQLLGFVRWTDLRSVWVASRSFRFTLMDVEG